MYLINVNQQNFGEKKVKMIFNLKKKLIYSDRPTSMYINIYIQIHK